MSDTIHIYFSTACLHGAHADCRRACKFCGEACICNCHVAKPTRADPDRTTLPLPFEPEREPKP